MMVDDATNAWLENLLATIDQQDTERFLGFLTDDASFRFGSAAPAHGRDAIRAAVDGFFSTIAGCKHKIERVMQDAGVLVCEGEVTYTRPDDTQITLPFANIFEFKGELIANYKIYADSGPLYAE